MGDFNEEAGEHGPFRAVLNDHNLDTFWKQNVSIISKCVYLGPSMDLPNVPFIDSN